LRNASAETRWPYLRPWVNRALWRYVRRAPGAFLTSLLDWRRTSWAYPRTAVNLLQSFWARFGWNHIPLPGGWYVALAVVTVVGGAGSVLRFAELQLASRTVFASRPGQIVALPRALWLLALAGGLVWANAALRFHPIVEYALIPGARYAYPAIIPSVLALAGGWLRIVPRRARAALPPVLFSALGLLAIVSLWTLLFHTYGR
jgi:hypothetical protein